MCYQESILIEEYRLKSIQFEIQIDYLTLAAEHNCLSDAQTTRETDKACSLSFNTQLPETMFRMENGELEGMKFDNCGF